MGALFSKKKEKPVSQVEAFMDQMEKIRNAPPLAPAEINGLKLSYHYNDVKIRATYQMSGRDESVKKNNVLDLGVYRGEILTLVFDPLNVDGERDPENVAVFWKKTKLGDMRANKLRDMVKDWRAAHLPIFCAMAFPARDRGFFLEFGFYGKPGAK